MFLNVNVTGRGIVKTPISTDENGKVRDTLANNGRWFTGVREDNKMLNHKNGTVCITVNSTKTYQLLMQNNGTLARRQTKTRCCL